MLTLALAACGVVLGQVAIAGGSLLGLAVNPSAIGGVLVGIQALAGGVFGAAVLPALAWAMLRHVPLGLALLAPTLGAALGTAVEWIALDQSTFGGAAVGAVAAAALTAHWARRRGAAVPIAPDGLGAVAAPGSARVVAEVIAGLTIAEGCSGARGSHGATRGLPLGESDGLQQRGGGM
jgi:hypothetical protein